MAVRASMAALIARTRQMIGDVTTPQDFLDQDVQDAADAHRADIRYELLKPAPDIQPPQGQGTTAQFVWAAYFSDWQHWEDDLFFQSMTTNNGATIAPWALVTPVVSEPIAGRWTFAVTLPAIATPPAQFPPVYLSGKAYDLYRVAADLLERRIALRSFITFDMTIDGRTLHLNQILDRWEKLRMSYLAQSWNRSVELVRTDLAPDRAGGSRMLRSDAQGNLLPAAIGAERSSRRCSRSRRVSRWIWSPTRRATRAQA